MSKQTNQEYAIVHKYIETILPKLERDSTRGIHFPYLVATHSKYYSDMFVHWDEHHMAMRFAYAGKPQYLRYCIDNMLYYQSPDGFAPIILFPETGDHGNISDFHAQPFIMQGALIYLSETNDAARGSYHRQLSL